jgi:hypothetical protein
MMTSAGLEAQTNYVLWHIPNSFVLYSTSVVEEIEVLVTQLLYDAMPCTDLLLQTTEPDDGPGRQWCGPRLCALVHRPCPLDAAPTRSNT